MADRRRLTHRRRYHDHLKGGAGLAVLLGAIAVIGLDAANRSSGYWQATSVSLDPSSGNSTSTPVSPARAPDYRMTQAGLLPGEIVIETTGKTPAGQWRLGTRPFLAPPIVLDSIAAGPHELSLVDGDSVRWGVRIDLAPGGIAHVVVPALDSSTSTETAASTDSVQR